MILRRLAVALLLTCAATGSLQAQQAPSVPSAPVPGSDITVTLVTFGLGHPVFERFGHNALLFKNTRTQQSVAYHWGLYDFRDPNFILRFLTGDTKYAMGAVDGQALLESERVKGRPTTLQTLNLTPAQTQTLLDFVRWNALEENMYYRYDYYRDNCSTRLRDALDRAIGGVIETQVGSLTTDLTFRSETVRVTDGIKPIQLGTDIALGRPADIPLTQWQSFFLPMRLRDGIRNVKITGANGAQVPLVAREEMVPLPATPPVISELTSAPELKWRYGALGLALAALVVFLRIMMVSRRGAAWGLALFGSAWSLVAGLTGVILLLAWLATQHVFWAYNENVLLLSPMSLLLIVLIPASILSGKAVRAARMIAAFAAGMALIALVLALIPGGEQNGAVVALVLPVHLALAWALALPRGSARA